MDIKSKSIVVVNTKEEEKFLKYIYARLNNNKEFLENLAVQTYYIIKNRYPCEYEQETEKIAFKLKVFEPLNPYNIYSWEEFLGTKTVKSKESNKFNNVMVVKEILSKQLMSAFPQEKFILWLKEYCEEVGLQEEQLLRRKSLSQKASKLKEYERAGYDPENLPLLMNKGEIRNFIISHIYRKIDLGNYFIKNRFNVLELYEKAHEILNIQFSLEKPEKLTFDEEIKQAYKKQLIDIYDKKGKASRTKLLSEQKIVELVAHQEYYTLAQVKAALKHCFQLCKSFDNFSFDCPNFMFVIDKIAELNAIIYEIEKVPVTIEDMFKYSITQSNIFKRDVKTIFDYIYVNERTKEEISNLVNFDPKYNFPEARKMHRHFIIHSGGTNTGKTYNSIRKLMESRTGVYLAPLRLLALENQDTMLQHGVLCSLTTGEEEDIVPNATHVSSTVEKANLTKKYDLCVIDECQMISDRDRGWAWTEAILGILAPEIHLCTAPIAVELLIQIINDCGDTYELIEHERVTPLILEEDDIGGLNEVQPGDALICFSKKKVLKVSSALARKGINCSIIYGALPYATRKKQFERFLNKESNVVVSTDAIAMGLNLPIKRILFMETEKFDGQKMRSLNLEEIKQIAGRAGRRGIYEEGFVNSFENKKLIQKALSSPSIKITKAKINFPEALIELDKDLIETVKVWATLSDYSFYDKTDIFRLIYILEQLETFDLTKSEKLKLSNIPFQETEVALLVLWKSYIRQYMDDDRVLQKPEMNRFAVSLDGLELYYKKLDLYFSFSKNMDMEIDKEWLAKEKLKTAELINKQLIDDIDEYSNKCSLCGKTLPWDFTYNVCEKCYRKHY